ncbi:MAG: hypothetical protein ACLUSL_08650 [Ruminococcus sp.]
MQDGVEKLADGNTTITDNLKVPVGEHAGHL